VTAVGSNASTVSSIWVTTLLFLKFNCTPAGRKADTHTVVGQQLMKLTYRCGHLLIAALLMGVLCAAMASGRDPLLSRAQAQDGAQNWPLKPIHAIVPFTPGSATDIVARAVFEPLSRELGQSVIVENRPGAGGMIGAGMVAKADPDGYSLLVSSSSHTIIPALYPKVPYDTVQDFAGVIPLGSLPNVLVVAPSKGFHTLNDLIAAAKASPGMMTYASAGVGSATHFAVERFRLSAGLDGVHVPFRGSPEAATEVMTGRVDFFFGPLATVLPFIRDGKLAALAVSTPKRAAALPDVPTTLEAGYANSDYTFWVAMFARARTPGPIVQKLHDATRKILASAGLQDKLADIGVDPMDMEPADLDTLVRTEIAINTPLVRAAHIQVN
jgi:tripartite-type tricarboxylate transporter receptor subunit TctC